MSPIEGTPSVEPKNSEVDKNPGVVSRMAHSALSKENFVGMGVGFAAREALKTIVGGQ